MRSFEVDMSRIEDAPASTRPPAVEWTAFKNHASCGATHSMIDAIDFLMDGHGLSPEGVQGLVVTVHPFALKAAGIRRPADALAAKNSLWHTSRAEVR